MMGKECMPQFQEIKLALKYEEMFTNRLTYSYINCQIDCLSWKGKETEGREGGMGWKERGMG